MKVLMLSWEYPPKNIGGISNHVYNLTKGLKEQGVEEIHVITCEEGTAPIIENNNGIVTHRVTPYKLESEDFVKWVMQLNFAMIEEGNKLINKFGKFDIIHAHDWLTAFSAKVLKWSYNIPLVSTIHATEYGRNNGINTEMQRYISSAEWMLTNESWKTVACSHYMRQHLSDLFKAHWDNIWVIPNGINKEDFKFEFNQKSYREKFASEDEKIVFFIGRHVFEKGIHLLIEAMPEIVKDFSKVKVVIAGIGPMTEELKQRAKEIGVAENIIFTGYMEDIDRNRMYKVADMAVFPSLYEPFGIVALEAMAAGCPVIASGCGGLGEIIQHKYNGMKVIPGSIESLTCNILELIRSDKLAETIRQNAYLSVSEQYSWDKASQLTFRMYNLIKEECRGTEWDTHDFHEKKNQSDNRESLGTEELVTLENIEVTKKKSTSRSKKTKVNKEQSSEREIAADSQSETTNTDTETKPKRRKRTSTAKTQETT
jgi:glycogen synthase